MTDSPKRKKSRKPQSPKPTKTAAPEDTYYHTSTNGVKYKLHKTVGKNGNTLHFFSQNTSSNHTPCPLPEGHVVMETKARFPFIAKAS